MADLRKSSRQGEDPGLLAQLASGFAQLQAGRGLACERRQHLQLLRRGARPWREVEHAQGAEALAASVRQGGPGIEADLRVAENPWVFGEARILQGVLHDEDAVHAQADRVIAEGVGAQGGGRLDAGSRHQPLCRVVEEGDHADRSLEQLPCERRQLIEFRLHDSRGELVF
jgi:hypothetical protein